MKHDNRNRLRTRLLQTAGLILCAAGACLLAAARFNGFSLPLNTASSIFPDLDASARAASKSSMKPAGVDFPTAPAYAQNASPAKSIPNKAFFMLTRDTVFMS